MPRTDIPLKDLDNESNIALQLEQLKLDVRYLKSLIENGNGLFEIDSKGKAVLSDAIITAGQIDIGNAPLYYEFEYGEDITENQVVCFKPFSDTELVISSDTYVDEQNPTTNYSSESQNNAGVRDVATVEYERWILLKFSNTFPSQICKSLILNLTINQRTKTSGGDPDISYGIYLTEDSFDTSTVTWNTKPSKSGGTIAVLAPTGTGSFNIDLDEQRIREIQVTGTTITGFIIAPVNPGVTTGSNQFIGINEDNPTIDFTKSLSDGKIYVADNSAYETCARVIGRAMETKVSGLTGKVQVAGIFNKLSLTASHIGALGYLRTTGTIGLLALSRWIDYTQYVIEMGNIISSSEINFNVRKPGLFLIETLSGNHTEGDSASVLYPLPWASQAIIEYTFSTGISSQNTIGYVRLFRSTKHLGILNPNDETGNTNGINALNVKWNGTTNLISFECLSSAKATSDAIVGVTAYIYE